MSNEEKMAIERQEITDFMEYFKSNVLDFGDSIVLKKLYKHIEKVFKLEIEELGYEFGSVENNNNTFELHFINDPKISSNGFWSMGRILKGRKIVPIKPSITLNISKLFEGLDNIDKEKRLKTCKKIFYVVFHEIQHERQDLMVMQQVSSKESLRYARDFACQMCLEEKWYKKNYDNYLIEKNARIVGHETYLKIMQDEDEEFLTNIEFEKGKYYTGRYMIDVWTEDKATHFSSEDSLERDKVTTTVLDNLICKQSRTELLELYPILQKEYNMDGSRKSVTELIDNMRKEIYDISGNTELSKIEKDELIKDAQEMYYELIYIQIEKGVDNPSTQKEIKELVSKIGKKEFINILKRMIYYFLTQLQDYLNESVKLANLQEKKDRKRLSEDYVEKITILLELEAKYDAIMIKPIKSLLIKILEKLYLSDVFYNNALQRSLKGKKSAEEAIKRDENEIAEKNK